MNLTWIVRASDQDNLILKDFLKSKAISRSLLKSVKGRPNSILVNNEPEKVTKSLQEGDLVTFKLPDKKASSHVKATEGKLNILYEDDYFIALNKPANIPSLPSHQNKEHTMANFLLWYFEKMNYQNTSIHPVSRLDKDTSGVIIYAKSGYIHHLFSKTTMKKRYKAVVEGALNVKEDIIDFPIARAPGSIIKRAVLPEGKPAITKYSIIKKLPELTYIDIELLTGRTHQIRVHFSYINHPLAGDDLYGGSMTRIKRQALHCYELTFEHPITKDEISLQVPLPKDIETLIKE